MYKILIKIIVPVSVISTVSFFSWCITSCVVSAFMFNGIRIDVINMIIIYNIFLMISLSFHLIILLN